MNFAADLKSINRVPSHLIAQQIQFWSIMKLFALLILLVALFGMGKFTVLDFIITSIKVSQMR
jgi:hypothetical protein